MAVDFPLSLVAFSKVSIKAWRLAMGGKLDLSIGGLEKQTKASWGMKSTN
jgi:hypothetical protein